MKHDAQIALFLDSMKRIVRSNSFILVNRRESMQFLADNNISARQLEDLLLTLAVDDCFDGPEPDRDPRFSRDWTVAEFCPELHDTKIYLKVSICIKKNGCKCLSVKLYSDRNGL